MYSQRASYAPSQILDGKFGSCQALNCCLGYNKAVPENVSQDHKADRVVISI